VNTACKQTTAAVETFRAMQTFERVAGPDALPGESSRFHTRLQGRSITLVRHHGKVYCIDSVCYHVGGPLGIGDIEDIDGQACIKCPWHGYLVTLDNGQKMYKAVEFADGKMVSSGWKISEKLQRTHLVDEREDGLYVALSTTEAKLESDQWAFREDCAQEIQNASRAKPRGCQSS